MSINNVIDIEIPSIKKEVKTIKEGIYAAKQIIFVLSKGKICTANIPLDVAKNKPRVTYWHNDRSFWVSLSILDDVVRGAYSAVADAQGVNL